MESIVLKSHFVVVVVAAIRLRFALGPLAFFPL
jgi:hypothetical protein